MPARHTVLIIIAFWLVTAAWLFHRDLRPYLLSGTPPPFTISLTDEAEAQRGDGTMWSIFQGQQTKGYAVTKVRYDDQQDTFRLSCKYKLWLGGRFSSPEPDIICDSAYDVTRDGDLRELTTRLEADLLLLVPTAIRGSAKAYVKGSLRGRIQNGMMSLHAEVFLPAGFGGHIEKDLDPVAVKARGSVLNSMQPLNRLPGLRRGQHWQMPYVDPLADIIRAAAAQVPGLSQLASPHETYLEARVLPETSPLERNDGKTTVECLVVEYRGDDLTAHTWVGREDDLVYEQEVTYAGDRWRMVRQDPGSRINDDFEHPSRRRK